MGAGKTGGSNVGISTSAWGTNSPQAGRKNESNANVPSQQFIDPAIAGMGNVRMSDQHSNQQQAKVPNKVSGSAGWNSAPVSKPAQNNNQNNKKQKQKNGANNQKQAKANNNTR